MHPLMEQTMLEIKKMIKGKDDVILKVLLTILANGHILLEDIPGVGKTTLAMSLSKVFSLEYKRVQFTPDVLPSDITGFTMYRPDTKTFEYHAGAALTNLFLADEINRTSPKTQSALLELMEEGKITVDGVAHSVPSPFIVIATQNPFGSAGTQRLPESQLDRFMVRLSMGYPEHSAAVDILKEDVPTQTVNPVIDANGLLALREEVRNVHVSDAIYEYIVSFSEATREHEYIELGLSPRGSKALLRMAKASAVANERNYVTLSDVVDSVPSVVTHRLVCNSKGRAKDVSIPFILRQIVRALPAPGIS